MMMKRMKKIQQNYGTTSSPPFGRMDFPIFQTWTARYEKSSFLSTDDSHLLIRRTTILQQIRRNLSSRGKRSRRTTRTSKTTWNRYRTRRTSKAFESIFWRMWFWCKRMRLRAQASSVRNQRIKRRKSWANSKSRRKRKRDWWRWGNTWRCTTKTSTGRWK